MSQLTLAQATGYFSICNAHSLQPASPTAGYCGRRNYGSSSAEIPELSRVSLLASLLCEDVMKYPYGQVWIYATTTRPFYHHDAFPLCVTLRCVWLYFLNRGNRLGRLQLLGVGYPVLLKIDSFESTARRSLSPVGERGQHVKFTVSD